MAETLIEGKKLNDFTSSYLIFQYRNKMTCAPIKESDLRVKKSIFMLNSTGIEISTAHKKTQNAEKY